MKFAIVVSRFNQDITQSLLAGAVETFKKHGIRGEALKTVWVPGAYEIPFAALKLAQSRRYKAIVTLGCVLQGETDHNRYISNAAANGILQASLSTGVPITFGVLTPRTRKQALARSGKNSANKGMEAAEAALEMAGWTL